jgi:hypothetical protein
MGNIKNFSGISSKPARQLFPSFCRQARLHQERWNHSKGSPKASFDPGSAQYRKDGVKPGRELLKPMGPTGAAIHPVVMPSADIQTKATGSGAHAVAIGSLDDPVRGRESGAPNGVVFGAGPEAKDDEIGFVGFPPRWIADVGRGGPDYWTVAGGFGCKIHDQPGFVAEFAERLGEQAANLDAKTAPSAESLNLCREESS